MNTRDRTPNGKTTIQLSMETRDLLKSVGRKGDSYDTLVQRIVGSYIEHGGRDR